MRKHPKLDAYFVANHETIQINYTYLGKKEERRRGRNQKANLRHHHYGIVDFI